MHYRRISCLFACSVIFLLLLPICGHASGHKTITLLHTNDLHSHLMPFSPEIDYVPDQTDTDATLGGFARIATVLKNERDKRSHPTITVDSGDFTMGTLFHTLAREESFELRLMHQMGYDYVTLGNHEFDMFPDGLARIITTAHDKIELPGIVFSSAVFSGESDRDDTLEAVFERDLVKAYDIFEVDGLRIGFFGIMGKIAAGDAPFAAPVTFRDPVEVSREMVQILRDEENADIVVCLSHSGVSLGRFSEDEELAANVPGIDVIISGHSHTPLEAPLVVGDTIIVQADNYGKAVGVLDIVFNGEKTSLKDYKLVRIDDSIPADPDIQARIDTFVQKVDEQFLDEYGLHYWGTVGRTGFDMPVRQVESQGGNLFADAIRWYVDKHAYDPDDPVTRIQMAIKANGVIRADIREGVTGRLTVADLFRALPLGIGMDDGQTMGYPLVTSYLHAYEIKRALEVITTVHPLRGNAYFLQLSGVRFTYNPYRVPFDRVTGIWVETIDGDFEPLDYSRANRNLYRVAVNIYEATFLKVIGSFTHNILTIVPKDRNGNPIDSLVDFRVDADPEVPGIQELKEWVALIQYIADLDDLTGDGLPDIPDRYRQTEGRIVNQASINPINLVSRGTLVTWAAVSAILLFLAVIAGISAVVIKFVRRK